MVCTHQLVASLGTIWAVRCGAGVGGDSRLTVALKQPKAATRLWRTAFPASSGEFWLLRGN